MSFWLTLAIVALAPLPFGSGERIWVAVWCFLLALSLATASLRGFRAVHAALLGPVLAAAAAFAAVLWLQTTPNPWIGSPDPVWQRASEALGEPLTPVIAASRSTAWPALGSSLTMLLAFLCAYVASVDRTRAQLMLKVLAFAGVVYAVLGTTILLIDPTKLLWREKEAYLGNMTGTFVNRNTAATYFGSCATLWFLMITAELQRWLPREGVTLGQFLTLVLYKPPRRVILAFVGFLICLGATFMTGSRAGTLVTLAALGLAASLAYRTQLSGRIRLSIVAGAVAAIGLVLAQLWGGEVAGRIETSGLADAGRWETYRSTLRIIGDHPWFGTGLGTFINVYPAYRSPEISAAGIWDLAHSTPLELAAEMGLPIAGIVLLVWGLGGAQLLRGSLKRRRDGIFPMAGLAVGFLGSAHSLVDFSLQITGYAIVFAAIVGCGLAQSVGGSPSDGPRPSRSHRGSRAAPAERALYTAAEPAAERIP